MPVCRHCGPRISKFDKDRCPVCGELNPLDGVNSDTIEITRGIDITPEDYKDYKPKTRKIFLLLSCLAGWFGVQFFYLKYRRAGLIWLAASLVLVAGLSVAFYFITHIIAVAILIGFGIGLIPNAAYGLVIYRKPSFKDGDGNLLK